MNIRQQLNDWCHLCGRRCTYTAAIHYASNAEHDPCGPLTNYVRACAACADAIGIAARGNSKPPPAVSRFRDPLWSEFRGQLERRIMEIQPIRDPSDLCRDSGIYFVCDQDDEIVYIGKAANLRSRWASHQFKSEVRRGDWTIRSKPPDTESFCNLEHEEATYIAILRPRFNKVAKFRVWPIGFGPHLEPACSSAWKP